ncbi:hypothetical protein GGI12_006132, partial [Dipsacomyces acuminosporus]
ALEMFEAFLMTDSGIEGAELLDRDATNAGRDIDGDADYVEDSDEDIDLDADGIITALMDAIGSERLDDKDQNGNKNSSNKQQPDLGSKAPASGTTSGRGIGVSSVDGVVPKTASENNRSSGASVLTNNTSVDKDVRNNKNPQDDMALHDFMAAMDQELSSTNVGMSFAGQAHRSGNAPTVGAAASDSDDLEGVSDVDIDLNLVENIVESFRAQQGLPGPAGTILGQFGIHLPH